MSTPTFEYEGNGYVPELLEHYLRRFEELLGASQLSGVNSGSENSAGHATTNVLHGAAYYGGTPAASAEMNSQISYGAVTEIEQNIRTDSSRRIFNNENRQERGGSDEQMAEVLRELQLRLDDLIRAVEQNTERLGEQKRDGLEIND